MKHFGSFNYGDAGSNDVSKRRSSQVFQKQFNKFINHLEKFTFYTVNGISLQSQFNVKVVIKVDDIFGLRSEKQTFPFIVRSQKCGQFIHDTDEIEVGIPPTLSKK